MDSVETRRPVGSPAGSENEATNPAATLKALDAQALLERLLAQQLLDERSAAAAPALMAQSGISVLAALLRLNAVAELPLYQAAAEQLGFALMDALTPGEAAAREAAARSLGLSSAWLSSKGVSVRAAGETWEVAFKDAPGAELRELFGRKARQAGAGRFSWALMLPSVYEQLQREAQSDQQATSLGSNDDLRALRELAEEGPTIELVNTVLSRGVTLRASDLHFEPHEADFVVRARVDGDMLEQARYSRERFDAVACRLKILASLDIAERRLPQDGRISARVNGESFDIRVSILPGALGESIVLRLLRQERKPTRLQDLGMSARHAAMFESWGRLSNGIVLVTGPTGSGKSTTLYTALELANDKAKKIITVEDPVEYKIRGITQLQVNADIGFTFAAALRSILRHDPDTILLGEVRDEETARIAIQSALTGHLVLSTLHTNSAIGAVTRLIDMGVEPFLIGASLRGLMAQRLVRRLCEHCAEPQHEPDDATLAMLARFQIADGGRLRKPVGCAHCSGTGYWGRMAIYDLIEVGPEMAHRISAGDGELALLRLAGRSADDGLLHSGVELVAEGRTTLGEVLRASGG